MTTLFSPTLFYVYKALAKQFVVSQWPHFHYLRAKSMPSYDPHINGGNSDCLRILCSISFCSPYVTMRQFIGPYNVLFTNHTHLHLCVCMM